MPRTLGRKGGGRGTNAGEVRQVSLAHAPIAGRREASRGRSWGGSRPSQAGSRQQAGRQGG